MYSHEFVDDKKPLCDICCPGAVLYTKLYPYTKTKVLDKLSWDKMSGYPMISFNTNKVKCLVSGYPMTSFKTNKVKCLVTQ